MALCNINSGSDGLREGQKWHQREEQKERGGEMDETEEEKKEWMLVMQKMRSSELKLSWQTAVEMCSTLHHRADCRSADEHTITSPELLSRPSHLISPSSRNRSHSKSSNPSHQPEQVQNSKPISKSILPASSLSRFSSP